MNKNKSALSIRVGIISIIFLFAISIIVFGDNVQLKTIKIQFANNSEITIFSTQKTVQEILDDANIKLLEDEEVTPELDQEVLNDGEIIIYKEGTEIKLAQEQTEELPLEVLEDMYGVITEKIEVVTEEIPFETIQKEVSDKSGNVSLSNKIVQQGENGIKEVKYSVKYKNEKEISREEIETTIVKEPVDRIIEVVTASITSRSEREEVPESGNAIQASVANIEPEVTSMNATAYTASTCGKDPSDPGYGITASGNPVEEWYTVAAGSTYPMGTVIYIPYFKDEPNEGWFVVQDRGGAISNSKIDIYMGTYDECIQFGRRTLECYVYEI